MATPPCPAASPLRAEDGDGAKEIVSQESDSGPPFLRRCLQWTGFFSGIVVEIWIHSRNGVSREVFEAEEDCLLDGDSPWRCQFITVFEIICRMGMTTVLLGLLWELASSASNREANQCLFRTFIGPSTTRVRSVLLPMVLALSLFVIGTINAFFEESLPPGGPLICHVADVFCHGIVMSAVLGLLFDAGAAVHGGDCKAFMMNFVWCQDTIEAHGVADSDDEQETNLCREGDEAKDAGGQSLPRTLIIWGGVLVVLAFSILEAVDAEHLPTWGEAILKMEGSLCWAGIAWWLASSLSCGQLPCGPGAAEPKELRRESLSNESLSEESTESEDEPNSEQGEQA